MYILHIISVLSDVNTHDKCTFVYILSVSTFSTPLISNYDIFPCVFSIIFDYVKLVNK